jgi:filamentous hemagglutinin
MTTVPYTFGNESSPIPLSQLDANFAVTPQFANTAGNVVNANQPNITSVGTLTSLSVSGNINGGNLRTTGSISATGNIATGNVATGGTISAFGTVTGGNLATGGTVSATANITAGNVLTGGRISAAGNITSGGNLSVGGNITSTGQISAQGNILAQGIVSATGNISTAGLFIGNFQGNITGNLAVNGSNTQVLFNQNGNVGAAGGLTYDSGSNTLGILGVVSAQGNIFGANLVLSGTGNLTTGGNVNVGANLVVSGTTQLVGVATAPTAPNATSNNQVASTAFVQNQINQNATNVTITGGNITVTNLTANSGNITATTFSTANWTVREYSGNLFFQYLGANKAKLDSNGNFTTTGNVTGFGTL